MPHHHQPARDFFFLGSQADGQEGAVWGAQGDVVDQAAALEEGVLTMNTAGIILVALAYVDDATSYCAPKSWLDTAELPFEVFYYCHPGSVLCNFSICGWSPHGPEPPVLEVD